MDSQAAADIPPGVRIPDAPLAKVPTTEELLDLEKEIHRLLEKKRKTDLHIIDLEARIHALETEYLKETGSFGPLLNGLEGYLGSHVSGASGGTGSSVRKTAREIKDSDRVFSNTSSSYPRALAVHGRLVKEKTLNSINLSGSGGSNKKISGTDRRQGSAHSGLAAGNVGNRRKRLTSSDPAWSTPSRPR